MGSTYYSVDGLFFSLVAHQVWIGVDPVRFSVGRPMGVDGGWKREWVEVGVPTILWV